MTPRPVVLLGTWSSDLELAASLRARLGGREVICVGPPSEEVAAGLRSVDDWLVHHGERLGQFELEPPYLLFGYSFGGVLALEMARQVAESAPVAYVGMIDTIRPHRRPRKLREAVPYHLREAGLLADPGRQLHYLDREIRRRIGLRVPLWVFHLRRRLLRLPPAAKAFRMARPQGALVKAIYRCYLKYDARSTQQAAHLYVTEPSIDRCSGDSSLRWAPFLQGGFDVNHIDGTHFTLFKDEHVDRLAEEMRRHLDAIDPIDPIDAIDATAPEVTPAR